MNGLTHPETGRTLRVTEHAILRYAKRVEGWPYRVIQQIPRAQQQRYEAEILSVAAEGSVLNAAQMRVFLHGHVSSTDEIARLFPARGIGTNGTPLTRGECRMKDNHFVVIIKEGANETISTFFTADEAQLMLVESLATPESGIVAIEETWPEPRDVEILFVGDDGRVGFTPGMEVINGWLNRVSREERLEIFVGWDGLMRTAEILLKDRASVHEIPWPMPEREAARFGEQDMDAWVEWVLERDPFTPRKTFILCRANQAPLLVHRLSKGNPIPKSFLEAPERTGDVHGFTIKNGAIVKHHEVRSRP